MNSYKETFNTWNKVAKLYQDKFMDLDLYNETYDDLCENLSEKNPKILEIGCGPGNITKYLLKKRTDFDILGLDVAPNMIDLAKINNPQATFKVMDCREIDKIELKFDAIVCGFCLPYLSEFDFEKLVFDFGNLLNKRGIIYLSYVEGEEEQSSYQTGSSGDRIFFYFHSLKKIKLELNKNNFEIINLFNVNYSKNDGTNEDHTIILAKKNENQHSRI